MIPVIDIATPQATLTPDAAWAAGFRTVYVKLGGDNNPRYVAPYYIRQVDAFRARGFRIGHYWVPEDSMDPVGAADFFVNNLRGWTAQDFAVLDNENFIGNDPDGSGPQKDSLRYSDAQAAAWINRVKSRLTIPGRQVKTYSGLADARATAWPNVLATGTQFIIAAYSYAPFEFPTPTTIPADRIDGHQYGGQIIGGVATDVNMFRDDAFNYGGDDMLTDAQAKQLDEIYKRLAATDLTNWVIAERIKPQVAELIARPAFSIDSVTAAFRTELAAAGIKAADIDAIAAAVRAKFASEPLS